MHIEVLASPTSSVIVVPNRQRLEQEASYWLGTRFTLRWSYDKLAKRFDGFEVLGEGGLYKTVKLSERGLS